MTIQEKRRAAFEAWASDAGKWPKAIERTPRGDYRLMQTHLDWRAWNAALDSVVITLPAIEWPEDFEVTRESDPEEYEALETRAGCQATVLHLCKRAIEAAGLKVKT